MNQSYDLKFITICTISLFALALIWSKFIDPPKGSFSKNRDIYHIHQDATLLANGENPYSRIASGNMTKNEKYTFYLPGFLIIAATSIKLGLKDYQDWMPYWLSLAMLFHIAVGVAIYFIIADKNNKIAATLGALFWIFSRWPLALLRSGQIDSIAIFFFVCAIFYLPRNIIASALLLSVSLSIKQMAALVAPLYIIWAYQDSFARAKKTLLALILIPALLSIPFIIWDFESFIKMIFFPLTREPLGAKSVDIFLRLPEKLSKLPFLIALIATYFVAWKSLANKYALIFFTIMVTLSFNPVFFSRYFCWAMPLIPIICFLNRSDDTTLPHNHLE